ncbi:MAG: TRAP transporter substrate-binding protein DctP [Deltaproteobacteria bacterium]|nr:TRAP transporter substrate-binding protein DctP [Deltaproteobacteria bacterium]
MGKKAVALFSALAMMVVFGLADTASAKVSSLRWKFGTLAPQGVGWARHIEGLVLPAIKEATDGYLAVKTYWGGVMGDEEDYIRKMHIGQLHGAGMSGQGAVMVCPEMAVVELPFMFRNFDEVDYIKTRMSETFDGIMRENGYFMVAWVDQDLDQIYSIKAPIAEPRDFENTTFITWYGPLEETLLRTLGAKIIPVNVPEVPSAIRQGMADAAIGPALFTVGAQLYTVYKYVTPINIRYSPSVIVVTNEAWAKLPEKYHGKFYDLRDDLMTRFALAVRKDNQEALNAMYKYGIKKVEPSPQQLAALKKRCLPLWDKMADTLYPRELLDEMLIYLAEYRGEKAPKRTGPTFAQAAPKAAPVPIAPKTAPKTGTKTASSPKKPSPPEGLVITRNIIRQVQIVLADEGLYNIGIDGLFGPKTFWGIKRYQRKHGLSVTGAIDRRLLDEMRIPY